LSVQGQSDEYELQVTKGLNRVFDDEDTEEQTIERDDLQLVVFSDHHKGARDGADDFMPCERAYHAALGHYLELGHRLFVLGDAEELWECGPAEVVAAYGETLALEGRFLADGRYERFLGNHDDDWRSPRLTDKHLGPSLPSVHVREALKLHLTRQGDPAGSIFFAHGHQGTSESDRFAFLSRLVVRHFWRRAQRKFGFSATTPARSFELRARHDRAMFRWARNHPARPILVAGHTHRPVFWQSQPPRPDRPSASDLECQLAEARAAGAAPAELAGLRAELEAARAEERTRAHDRPPTPIDPPCYFNTGCCSFPDGDATGLEIAHGTIRLVRWPDDGGKPRPKILVEADLGEVLRAVSAN
jgi:hypothetical protein